MAKVAILPIPDWAWSSHIIVLDTMKNGSVLDGSCLKTIGVDVMEEALREVHVIKVVTNLFLVTLDDALGFIPMGLFSWVGNLELQT